MTSSDTKKTDERACLGKITSPHGVKGLVKIFPYGEDPKLLGTIDPIFTSKDKQQTISVTLKNAMGKYILASVKDCNTREGAEKIKGTELWVSREHLPQLDNEDEYYIEDLQGLSVLNEDNQNIGTIATIQNYGAGDLLEIKPKSGASYFVPFQNEYIINISLNEQTITLQNAEMFRIE